MDYLTRSRKWTYLVIYLGFNAILLLLIGVGIAYLTDFYPQMTVLVIGTWILGIVIAMASVALTPGIFIRINENSEIRRANKKILPPIDEPSKIVEEILPNPEGIDSIPEEADITRLEYDEENGTVVYYK